jgi:predicted acylesterase/phospholipase RssA
VGEPMGVQEASHPESRQPAATYVGPENECDLVMKGGVTSGVVYPPAISEVAKAYRLRNVGGASAGAIAAVVGAACEHRRQAARELSAFDELDSVAREITQPDFVLELFQPTAAAKPMFDIALGFITSTASARARGLAALVAILRVRPLFLAAAALLILLWAAFVVVTAWALVEGGVRAIDVAALVLLAVLVPAGFAALVTLVAAVALLRFGRAAMGALRANEWGMCSGRREGDGPAGLSEWLHETIQRCAGAGEAAPLTFRDLVGDSMDDRRVNLQLISTDLSAGRPVTFPLPELDERSEGERYWFAEDEFRRVFPDAIVDHLVQVATRLDAVVDAPTPAGTRRLHVLPGLDLPVLVAARLSLSLPMLLSTVPLWYQHHRRSDTQFLRHTMSDGGISSNFPIHYFDSLLPGRPTFGIDLQAWRGPDVPPVEMSDEPRLPQFSEIKGVGSFWLQLLNAARNWRDTLQAELPGYRDRICQVRLTEKEGGLNLNMPQKVVRDLVERGREAGQAITGGAFDWDRHRIVRYRTWMQVMQHSLGPDRGVSRPCVYQGSGCGPGKPFRDVLVERAQDREGQWWARAMGETDELLRVSGRWAPAREMDFDHEAPRPSPTIRISPRA